MAAKVSQLLNGGIRYGKDIKTSTTGIEPGMLVQLDSSGSTVSASGSSAALKPFGIAYGNRYMPYRPTSRVFASGEPLTVIWGTGLMLLSADFFAGGTLPAAQTKLYGGNAGLWTTSVWANQVGDVIGTRTRIEPVGGVGSSQNLAVVRFNIQP
jgi:hypothetical protein